jgi:hypothetical protein
MGAAVAHACGLQAVGYSTGHPVRARGYPAKSSGSRPRKEVGAEPERRQVLDGSLVGSLERSPRGGQFGRSPAPSLHFLDANLVIGFEIRHSARYRTCGRKIHVDAFNEELRAPLSVRRNLQTESQFTGVVLGLSATGDPGFATEPVSTVTENELPLFDTSVISPTLGELVLDLEEVGKVGIHSVVLAGSERCQGEGTRDGLPARERERG